MALTSSSVKRSVDATGNDIITLHDSVGGGELQAVALVDAALAHAGIAANPLAVSDGWATNDVIDATATVSYVGKERADGAWWLLRLDATSGLEIRHATIANNALVTTYAAAWAARATTLVYGLYSVAF